MTDITDFSRTIAVVGLGLIGGSLCKALKKYTSHRVLGLDSDPSAGELALSQGAVDRMISLEELSQADITLVCLHPQATIRFLTDYAARLRPGSIAADVCGVKGTVIQAVEPALLAHGVRYVGCHPMAGREFSGFAYSLADLFLGASFIMTPTENTDPQALRELEQLARLLGFGQVVRATAAQHDRTIAFTSQLAHVVSSAYIKSPSAQEENGFSAGSFQDMTRVAKLNESMWTELFLYNAKPLCEEIDTVIRHLTQYRDAIASQNREELWALLKDGRERKEASIRLHTK